MSYTKLTGTLGCIRTTNAAVNEMIDSAQKVADVDPLDRIFVGDEQTLIALADKQDSQGNYLNPDLRVALGANGFIAMTEEQRREWEDADVRRKLAEKEKKEKKND